MEYSLKLSDHAMTAWFGSNLGYLFHLDRAVGVMDWWIKFMEVKDWRNFHVFIAKGVPSYLHCPCYMVGFVKSRNNFIFRGEIIFPNHLGVPS